MKLGAAEKLYYLNLVLEKMQCISMRDLVFCSRWNAYHAIVSLSHIIAVNDSLNEMRSVLLR